MKPSGLTMALTGIFVIAFSVVATLLLAIPMFHIELDAYHLNNYVNLTNEETLHNFHVLMGYLLNPFSKVLDMPDLASSKDGLKHFADVKKLFMLAGFLMIVTLPVAIKFVRTKGQVFFLNSIKLWAYVPIMIGVMASFIGFDTFFTIFHEVFFRDDTWLFNPATDPVINILPMNYFMHCFIIFVVIYETIWFALFVNGKRQLERISNEET
jgi:integral membrane protein (TIGR01906 family)